MANKYDPILGEYRQDDASIVSASPVYIKTDQTVPQTILNTGMPAKYTQIMNGVYAIQTEGDSLFSGNVTVNSGSIYAQGILVNETSPYNNGNVFEVNGAVGFYYDGFNYARFTDASTDIMGSFLNDSGAYGYIASNGYGGYFGDPSNYVYLGDGNYAVNAYGTGYFINGSGYAVKLADIANAIYAEGTCTFLGGIAGDTVTLNDSYFGNALVDISSTGTPKPSLYATEGTNSVYLCDINYAVNATAGDIAVSTDTGSMLLGAGQDMSVSYDGTQGLIDTSLVAASDLHIDCGTDKTIVLDETVWDDFPPNPIVAAKLGANAPTLATFVTDIEQYTFDASNDYVIGSTEMPHNWKEGTVIYPHIHWATNGTNATDRGVKWQLKWTVGDPMETFSAQVTSVVDVTIPLATADRYHFISEFTTTLNGANLKIGAVICWRLERIATAHANGAPANDPFALSIGFHGEMDTVGSRGRTSK